MPMTTGNAQIVVSRKSGDGIETLHFKNIEDLFTWIVGRNLYESVDYQAGLARLGLMSSELSLISSDWHAKQNDRYGVKHGNTEGREVSEPNLDPPEPLDESVELIYHNDIEYSVDLDSDSPAEVTYTQSVVVDSYHVHYHYLLKGCHSGPEIHIIIENPQMERDDDGWNLEYNKVKWADDNTPFDDDVLTDCYWDAVRDDIKELLAQS